MLSLIQRVTSAHVTINHQEVGKINTGILALIAVEKNDSVKEAQRLLERILNYRIFADGQGRMNLSLRDINGGLLLVPQFTLAADTNSGNRLALLRPLRLKKAERYLTIFRYWRNQPTPMSSLCLFGADMQVALVNDGPVTFMLRTMGTPH